MSKVSRHTSDGRRESEGGDSEFALGHSHDTPAEPAPFAIPNSQFVSRPSPPAVVCPFCDSSEVELFSLFGSQLLTSEYYCRNCSTVFEHVK